MMNSCSSSSERGSLPIALLAAIIMAGVLVALFTVVSTGQDTAQRDRDVAAAFQVADAGLQEAFVDLISLDFEEMEPTDPAPCKNPSPGSTVASGECSKVLPDGSEVVWEYEQVGESRRWVVVSRGTFGRSMQVVRAEAGQTPAFSASIMSDTTITLNGMGTAVDGNGCNLPSKFSMAAAGQITINGQGGQCIEGVTVHQPAPAPDLGAGGGEVEVVNSPDPIDIPDLAGPAWDDVDGICFDPDSRPNIPGDGALTRGQEYCAGSLTIGNLSVGGDGNEPAIIYVQNDATPAMFANWNNTPGADAKDLQIHVAGGQGFNMGPNRNIRAAITAPNGPCVSNGQGTASFEGALACKSVTVNGKFDYDASVFEIMSGAFRLSLFSQEARNFES